ncbi:MAG: meiotic recombination [Alectoria fallacina]|uniref:Double-strand break repair protein n=1 Tax=Alectoria fallacina TaxID=1903189 RepID=A0A8H3IWK1_9LECA|nr:MAG: meiotic recombination [Alectoria fallacina]
MPGLPAADTIRILVATDNHVGYAERDAIRGDDSWKSFHEVMCLAKERDVDMVLLAGDLFHDNKPSRKAMFNVMRSLRMNCYGEKPCELEILSDSSEVFEGAFNHVNYEDPDINVAIPVFSIHGNHDDPSGDGRFAALDLLQAAGLVNYYGRTPEADNLQVKPVLLQKGNTKLALFGISNVRDERLNRTFTDGKVKFFQPGTQKRDWFNLICVHQNHVAHTPTGFLPEKYLPEFLDMVIWGHEHECKIDPVYNPEMNFHVMQPGSSVATSLMPGEAVPKHVAVLSITGRDFTVETIRLKTVRPFVMREIVLSEEKEAMKLAKKANNRTELTQFLTRIIEDMIKQANEEWKAAQGDEEQEDDEPPPLPLIRLRVEYTAPEGGNFDCENPQRFSNRFTERVANIKDVVQFYRKKAGGMKRAQNGAEMPEESMLASLGIDSVKVDRLVREFLAAQSLTILPQNSFGDAVSQFIDKDDKHAMEAFVTENLSKQVEQLMQMDKLDEDNIRDAMEEGKSHLEELFASGHRSLRKKTKRKPRPDGWDSDLNGAWDDQPAAVDRSDLEDSDEDESDEPVARSTAKDRGKAAPKKAAAPVKKAAPAKNSRSKKKVVESEEEEEDEDVVMLDSDDDESQLFVKPEPTTRGTKKAVPAKAPAPKRAPARATATNAGKQSQLNFSQPTTQPRGATKKVQEVSDDDISDDDDAFEPAPSARTSRSRR